MAVNYFDMRKLLQNLSGLEHSLWFNGCHTPFENCNRVDWRPFWVMEKEIQSTFNQALSVTREERAELWSEFNDLRNKAKKHSNDNYNDFFRQSERYKNEILSDCNGLSITGMDEFINMLAGGVKFAVQEAREKGLKLNLVMKKLGTNKLFMLSQHKKECFEEIQKIKDSHDRFWSKYKEHQENRKSDFQQRVRVNIDSNKQKLQRAQEFLANQQRIVDECEQKLRENNSAKWRTIFEDRLGQAREKVRSAKEQIDRFETWIREGEEKLSNA